MRKLIAIFLTMIAVFGLAACGTPQDPSGGGSTVLPDDGEQTPPGGTETELTFTVTLMLDGERYIPETEIFAVWSDGISEYSAPFEKGIARTSGLDGEYLVTLSEVPTEAGGRTFTYDPNSNLTSNDDRDIEIELLTISRLRETGKGTGKYNPIEIKETGVFRTAVKKAGNDPENRGVFYQFKPKENGQYVIESLVHTVPNEINPILEVYRGTSANVFFDHTQDGGGKSSTFTKNFRYVVEITDDEVGSVFTFAVYAEGRNITYPVTVDFRLERPRDHIRDPFESVMVIPQEQFKQTPEYDKTQYSYVSAANAQRVFVDKGNFKLNPADGYYHLYDPITETYGEILYAKITKEVSFVGLDAPFTTVEYAGNKALTIGEKNYKLMIEGYENIKSMTEASGFSAEQYKEWEGYKGYGDYCNSDGVYAVTEELKEFLAGYSTSQSIFYDGLGLAETTTGYSAAEGSQWLFACGYYKKK